MSSPELRHLLYSVTTGNPTAVDQSFFASLNEDDERVLDVDEGDARRVAGDSVMDDVADVDGDHVQSVSEHAENSDGSQSEAVRQGESCQHLLQCFAAFNETITTKVTNNTSDASLGPALHSFGRYSGLATKRRKGSRMAGLKQSVCSQLL